MPSYADKNGKTKPAPKPAPPKFRYINYDLTKDDRGALADLVEAGELPASLLFEAVSEGWKFSLTPDSKHHCFVASLTDREPGTAFENTCLTGRGASPLDAVRSLLYRHVILSEGDWAFFSQRDESAQHQYS